MALGGGTFTTQNKILAGAYINFVSVANTNTSLSDRGVATIPLEMNWGAENEVITVELAEFQKNSQKIFGYAYTADELKPMREIFRHANKVHFFRLNSGGTKASNDYANAKYSGTRGNDIKIVIEANENSQPESQLYDVSTYLGTTLVDVQRAISKASELKNNDYVDFKTESVLALTASTPLTSGTNGTTEESAYQTYLDKIESYSFNAIGCMSKSKTVNQLFSSFCKRMRDTVGKKFQVVLFRTLSDYEGTVSVKNGLTGDTENPALIPWVTGVIAGTGVNKSATNMNYDGEYTADTDYTQSELEQSILEGSFMFHSVDNNVVVLEDINTFVSFTDEKSADFASNQTIRVLDQIANDIASIFSRYIGKIPNDKSGRISLWNDIVKHHKKLQDIRAIEDFKSENITIQQGDSKKAVAITDYVKPVNAMSQLYMQVFVE